MKWTIGMPAYNNFVECWFTIQHLRMFHDLTDVEIVVVDNYGDDVLKKFIENNGGDKVVYDRMVEPNGVSPAKNRIFEVARGEYVLIMDSHIMIMPGALDITPPGDDMIQGPLMYSSCEKFAVEWLPEWRANMWGIWGPSLTKDQLPKDPIKIWAMGAGFFACRRDSWLGFHKSFRGFGGETGYIQEKYRRAGREVWCYPNMIWQHLFSTQGRPVNIPGGIYTRVANYCIGFQEIGLDLAPVIDHFGKQLVKDSMILALDRGLDIGC